MSIHIKKVWWDGDKMMAEPIDPSTFYKNEQQPAEFPPEFIDALKFDAALREREACARVADEMEKRRCEAWHEVLDKGGEVPSISLADCAAAIRARGQA